MEVQPEDHVDLDRIVRTATHKRAWVGCSREDREDMQITALCAAMEAEKTWTGGGSKGGWIYTVVDRRLHDYSRSHGPFTRTGEVRLNLYKTDPFDVAVGDNLLAPSDLLFDPDAPIADTDTEHQYEFRYVRYLMQFLPEQQRSMIMLSYIDGMTQDQIGERFGIKKARVSQVMSIGMTSLRSLVTNGPPERTFETAA